MQPDRKRRRRGEPEPVAQPGRHLHRLFDDALVHCLTFAMGSVHDYRDLCFVSHRFRRLAATPRALHNIRVRSSRFTDLHCATLAQSSQAWRDVDVSSSRAITDAGVAALAPLTSLVVHR